MLTRDERDRERVLDRRRHLAVVVLALEGLRPYASDAGDLELSRAIQAAHGRTSLLLVSTYKDLQRLNARIKDAVSASESETA